ncbi:MULTISPECIES: hypothetical protein [unclassified Spiroplasma]|uniref:hypothetical protein n=1 Tax=unclassified Spiroplasma TaxID=2637901 RepID=UPI0030CCF96D
MPRLEHLQKERINKFLILLKNSDEIKIFFNDYKEIILNGECQYMNFFYDLDEFLKNKEKIREQLRTETVPDNKKIKFYFLKKENNKKMFLIKNLEKKANMLEEIHNILLELRDNAPKREMEHIIYLKILLLYFNDTTIEGKTLDFSEYEQWAKIFIEFANIRMNELEGIDLENIKIITDAVQTLFLDVFRDETFQRKYNLNIEKEKSKLEIEDVISFNLFNDALEIINTKIFKTYMEQLPIFTKKIPKYIREISIIKKYDILVDYKLFLLKRNEIRETIDTVTKISKELLERNEQYKNKIKKKENKNNTFSLSKMEVELVAIEEIINTLKLIEEYKHSKFIFAIRGIWNLILILYLKETNHNKEIKNEEFQKWIDNFIKVCKNQRFYITEREKFKNLSNFIEILQNFKKNIVTNKEFQEEVAIIVINEKDFPENISLINNTSSVVTNLENRPFNM